MNMRCVFRTQRHSQRTQLLDELHLLVTLLFPRYPRLSAAFAMALFSNPSPPPQPTSAESIPQTRGSWADWLDEERAEHRGMSVEEYNLLMARDFKLLAFHCATVNSEMAASSPSGNFAQIGSVSCKNMCCLFFCVVCLLLFVCVCLFVSFVVVSFVVFVVVDIYVCF